MIQKIQNQNFGAIKIKHDIVFSEENKAIKQLAEKHGQKVRLGKAPNNKITKYIQTKQNSPEELNLIQKLANNIKPVFTIETCSDKEAAKAIEKRQKNLGKKTIIQTLKDFFTPKKK